MKISELVAKLEQIRETEGDLDVKFLDNYWWIYLDIGLVRAINPVPNKDDRIVLIED